MKLNARKSMVAMGTALALSLTPVAVPTMAPVAVAAVNETTFASTWAKLKGKISELEVREEAIGTRIDDVRADVQGYTEALSEIGKAEVEHSVAKSKIETVLQELKTITSQDSNKNWIKPEVTEDNQGWMNGALSELGSADTALTKADNAVNAAVNAKKKADDDKTKGVFTCENAVNPEAMSQEERDASKIKKGEEQPGDSSSLGGSSNSGSSLGSFTSSGNRVIYKDGKKKCISNSEYFTDKLTKIVAVLGTIFTLITTVTKISDVMMKNNPILPPAPAA